MELLTGEQNFYICIKDAESVPENGLITLVKAPTDVKLAKPDEVQYLLGEPSGDQPEPANSLDHPYASLFFFCGDCQVAFATKTSYSLHKKKFHDEKAKKSSVEVLEKAPNVETAFQCTECGSYLKSKKTLKNHMLTKHHVNVQRTIRSRFGCLLCSQTLSRAEDLRKHYSDCHNVSLEVDNHKFPSYEDFQLWKKEVEVESSSLFVKYSGDKRHNEGKFIKQIFSCQRSGHFISHGIGQRRLKRTGSIKINGHCPARIHVTKWKDGPVEVSFTKTHLGHDNTPNTQLVEEHRLLEEAKAKLGKEINGMIYQCRTLEELEEIRKSLEPAKVTIAVMKRKRRRAELRAQYGTIPRNKKRLTSSE